MDVTKCISLYLTLPFIYKNKMQPLLLYSPYFFHSDELEHHDILITYDNYNSC